MADFNSPFKTPAQSLYAASPRDSSLHGSLYEASLRNGLSIKLTDWERISNTI
jgi:hypothetical protein